VAYNDLREWIAVLDKAGELKRITEPVSPRLEITEITDRVSKSGSGSAKGVKGYAPGGPALLFENIAGHPGHKVLINQFGSERRMALALGVEPWEGPGASVPAGVYLLDADFSRASHECSSQTMRAGEEGSSTPASAATCCSAS